MNYVKKIQDIHFLNRCKRNKIIPNFIRNIVHLSPHHLKNKKISRLKESLSFSLLNENLRKHQGDLRLLKSKIEKKKTILTHLPREQMENINNHLRGCLQKLKKETKSKLIRKFNSLSSCNNCASHVSNTPEHTSDEDTSPRVTFLTSNSDLPKGTAELLDLGPKFVPTKKLTKQTELNINVQLAKLAYRLRWREIFRNSSEYDNNLSKPTYGESQTVFDAIERSPFEKPCRAPEVKFEPLELSLQILKHEVNKVINKHKSKLNPPNLSQEQTRALSELIKMKRNREVRISVSDKGGEFVVMRTDLDNQLMEKHLENESLYEATTDLTQNAEDEINEVWEYVARKNYLQERTIARLKTSHSQCPVIYLLTKTHKFPQNVPTSDPDVIKVRPIISGCGGPADKISWLIQIICNPLLQFVKAHLRNTEQLLRNLRAKKNEELKNKILFSLDVVSLYPSVDNDAAIDTLRMYLEREKKNLPLCHFPVSDLLLLTKTIFSNNCFSWKRNYYRQLRGLAMGNRLAPILAILFLDRIENQAIYSDLSLSLFYRYIDDCIAPANNSEEASQIQHHLNSQDPSIRYEIELPGEDGFLPFLNTKVRVNDSGIIETGWYTKPANKGLMLHAKSNHPDHVKRAVINNTINTYTSICSSNDLLQEAEQTFKKRAQRNGYSPQYVKQVRSKPKRNPPDHNDPLPTLAIPYISDAFTNDLKKAVKRSNLDIRLVQRPQSSLKNILVESRPYDKSCKDKTKCNVCQNSSPSPSPSSHCLRKDVVYSIKCDLCNEDQGIYIGETSRPLATRFQEHFRSANNPKAKSYKNMAFSKHYKACHEGEKPKLTVKILEKTRGSLERKVTEAVLIHKLKPDLNGQVNITDYII